ncbi:MAG: calcium-binding protein [Alphaproteobacteria bacterium]|nr:MAG: calcium-binding protein [Alphaproteobacteria bacterium]
MPAVSSYALQWSNVAFSTIAASSLDLFITDGNGSISNSGLPQLSDSQVAELVAQGRRVVGYVNLDPNLGHFGIVAHFADSGWQNSVISQAVDLVRRGYSGVCLTGLSAYNYLPPFYPPGRPTTVFIRQMANEMALFVARIEDAITAVRPNAYVVAFNNPFFGFDLTPDAAGAQAYAAYLDAVDAHLLLGGGTSNYVRTALAGETLLIADLPGSPESYADSWTRGILYTTPNWSFNAFGAFAYPATAGADTLTGGDGPNRIYALDGDDLIDGGAGNDYIDGGAGQDQIFGGAGDDSTDGGDGRDQISGGIGNDFIDGGAEADQMSGGTGDDTFVVDHPGDQIVENAGGGRDVAYARSNYTLGTGVQVEILSAISQDATTAMELIGNALDQQIFGNAGANFIEGGGGADFLSGLLGDDIYVVDSADDGVFENLGAGRDVVYARTSYALNASQEIEVLSTQSHVGASAIDLAGNGFANELYGNEGANVLNGGGGADYLMGFGGADGFAFTAALGGGNVDQIADFVPGIDKILLGSAAFTGLSPGALDAGAFAAGTQAHDADDRIVYDSATGQLFFDSDGNGAGAAVLFATLAAGTNLSASDFFAF